MEEKELSFEVKVNATILYDYLLHHTYNSPAGILGSVVGAAFVVAAFITGRWTLAVGGAIILLYLPITLWFQAGKQAKLTPAFHKPLRYRLLEEGIEVSQEDTTQVCPWDQIYKVTSTKSSIVVYTSRVNAFLFARKDMGGLTNEVIRTISTHVSPDKVKIRW